VWKDALRPYVVTGRQFWRGQLRWADLGYARRISFSQFGEDLWLADYFSDTPGFYVDVGAFDPFNASNTLLLYRRGWSGINVEPDPAALARLNLFRRRDVNIGVAINDTEGEAPFIVDGSFSGLANEGRLWKNSDPEVVTVQTMRLDTLLREHRPEGEIDLLNIDCEGNEAKVLASNDWDRFRPRIVLVEVHPGASEYPVTFLTSRGYTQVAALGLTRVLARKEE
jgi:FkbM family methyltransferase